MNPTLVTTEAAVDPVFWFILGVSAVMLVGITAVMIYFVVRYRRSRCPVPESQNDGNLTLELIWTVIPTIIVMAMFYYGWAGYLTLRDVPKDALEVTATARMWSWDFEYPNGKHSDRLYVPAGKPVKVNLVSVDVIHSFFIPAFRVKRDMVPGMENYVWFNAEDPGSYDIFCAEYCGVAHANMITTVEAVDTAEFEEWLSGMEAGAGTEQGRSLLAQHGCLGCHSLDGSPMVGPSFKEIGGREVTILVGSEEKTVTSDADYLARAITAPGAEIVKGYPPVMPSYEGKIPEADLKEMVAYLLRIGHPEAESDASGSQTGKGLDGAALAQQNGCLGCHSTDGSRKAGPSFKGLYGSARSLQGGQTVTADEDYLARSIKEPNAEIVDGFPPMMPPYNLTEEELEAILEWLEGLK